MDVADLFIVHFFIKNKTSEETVPQLVAVILIDTD